MTMTYVPKIDFSGAARVTMRWPDFITICNAKKLFVQCVNSTDGYVVFAIDGPITYTCNLISNTLSSGLTWPLEDGYTQAQSDADYCSFVSGSLAKANAPLTLTTSDGRVRQAAEKPNTSRVTLYTHDWTNPTTWYTNSVRVVNEIPTTISGVLGLTTASYQLAFTNVIDTYHGNITGEDFLKDANGFSYRVLVTASGSAKVEQDPHFSSGGDYIVDYHRGIIKPISGSGTWADPINVTYHHATDSTFVIKPTNGKNLMITMAECQFSSDIVITDSISFQPYGKVEYFAPQLTPTPYPSGTLIPLGNPVRYKSMQDYFNEAMRSYPSYPPLGGNTWRGMTAPSIILNWDYIAAQELFAASGMQINISLDHNVPLSGSYATTTFYCFSSDT